MRDASAPGKVILLGEHAVVYGQPALAASLPMQVEIRARPRDGGVIVRAKHRDERVEAAARLVANACGVDGVEWEISGDLPIGGGLGSSAALSVALVRALGGDRPRDELLRVAQDSEAIFHGTSSGLDVATSMTGGLIRFRRGEPPSIEPVHARKTLVVVIGFSGRDRRTSANVSSLKTRLEADRARYWPKIERLGVLAQSGAKDVEAGELEALGAKLDEAHALLAACELSCPELDAIVRAAKSAGAFGAKLTGAGGGGAAIAIGHDSDRIARAIEAAGFGTRVVELG